MLQIKPVTNKEEWDGFIFAQETLSQSFFQSWNWAQVQEALHHVVYRMGLYDGQELVGVCLVIEVRARRGHYFHLRHGPILGRFAEHFDTMIAHVKEMARENKVSFIRMSPLQDSQTFQMKFLRERGFRDAPIHNMDAQNCWILDLEQTEDELLSHMRKSTRYLVRKAGTAPIKITIADTAKDYALFYDLYMRTATRHKFVPHKGMEEELVVFGRDQQAKLFLAEYDGKAIAGALIVFYGNQAIYHHAATDDAYRDVPAAYLLQWEIIKEAKRQGKKIYNFWGVVPEDKPKHPWHGLTLFKTGFGGRRVNYIHAQDLPLSNMYWKNWAIDTIWRIKKGY